MNEFFQTRNIVCGCGRNLRVPVMGDVYSLTREAIEQEKREEAELLMKSAIDESARLRAVDLQLRDAADRYRHLTRVMDPSDVVPLFENGYSVEEIETMIDASRAAHATGSTVSWSEAHKGNELAQANALLEHAMDHASKHGSEDYASGKAAALMALFARVIRERDEARAADPAHWPPRA